MVALENCYNLNDEHEQKLFFPLHCEVYFEPRKEAFN